MAHILTRLASDPAGVLKALGGASKRDVANLNKRIKKLEEAAQAPAEVSLGPEDLPDESAAEAAIAAAAEADVSFEDLKAPELELVDAGETLADLVGEEVAK